MHPWVDLEAATDPELLRKLGIIDPIEHATPSPALGTHPAQLRFQVWRFAPVPFLGATAEENQTPRWWYTEHETLAQANHTRDCLPPFTKSYIEVPRG